jgi:fido (protein-threonine AMPylation protein)
MPDTDPNSFTFSNFAVGFLAGVASSALVGYVIYRKQKKDAKADSQRQIMVLFEILKDGRGNRQLLQEILGKVNSLPETDRLQFLSSGFAAQTQLLIKVPTKSTGYVEAVLKYKALADAYAYVSSSAGRFEIIDDNGTIDFRKLVAAHAKMFPEGYLWAGRLRTEIVTIEGSYMARGRSMDAKPSSIKVGVAPPENIADELKKLLAEWNLSAQVLRDRDASALSEELAHFHQQFLLIHPFFDGNGRFARAILREQVLFLFGVDRPFIFDRVEYYEALHLADLRESHRLAELIRKEIEGT